MAVVSGILIIATPGTQNATQGTPSSVPAFPFTSFDNEPLLVAAERVANTMSLQVGSQVRVFDVAAGQTFSLKGQWVQV